MPRHPPRVQIACHNCAKPLSRQPWQVKRARFSFCSPACKSANADFNAHAASRNGDAQRGSGAGLCYIKQGGRHQHRIIAEAKIGRALLDGEIVHHIDGNRRNNAPENLQVMSQSDHIKHHWQEMRAIRNANTALRCKK